VAAAVCERIRAAGVSTRRMFSPTWEVDRLIIVRMVRKASSNGTSLRCSDRFPDTSLP